MCCEVVLILHYSNVCGIHKTGVSCTTCTCTCICAVCVHNSVLIEIHNNIHNYVKLHCHKYVLPPACYWQKNPPTMLGLMGKTTVFNSFPFGLERNSVMLSH